MKKYLILMCIVIGCSGTNSERPQPKEPAPQPKVDFAKGQGQLELLEAKYPDLKTVAAYFVAGQKKIDDLDKWWHDKSSADEKWFTGQITDRDREIESLSSGALKYYVAMGAFGGLMLIGGVGLIVSGALTMFPWAGKSLLAMGATSLALSIVVPRLNVYSKWVAIAGASCACAALIVLTIFILIKLVKMVNQSAIGFHALKSTVELAKVNGTTAPSVGDTLNAIQTPDVASRFAALREKLALPGDTINQQEAA